MGKSVCQLNSSEFGLFSSGQDTSRGALGRIQSGKAQKPFLVSSPCGLHSEISLQAFIPCMELDAGHVV